MRLDRRRAGVLGQLAILAVFFFESVRLTKQGETRRTTEYVRLDDLLVEHPGSSDVETAIRDLRRGIASLAEPDEAALGRLRPSETREEATRFLMNRELLSRSTRPELIWLVARKAGRSPTDLVTDLSRSRDFALAKRVTAAVLEAGCVEAGRELLDALRDHRPEDADCQALAALCELLLARDAERILSKLGHVQSCLTLIRRAAAADRRSSLIRRVRIIVHTQLPRPYRDTSCVRDDLLFLQRQMRGPTTSDGLTSLEDLGYLRSLAGEEEGGA